MANGVYLATAFAINAVAGVATGFMYDQIGGRPMFFWSGIFALGAIPVIFFLPKNMPSQKSPAMKA